MLCKPSCGSGSAKQRMPRWGIRPAGRSAKQSRRILDAPAAHGSGCGGRCRLAIADRCANKSSLHPPPAALGFVARASGAQVPLIPCPPNKTGRTKLCGPFCLAEKEGFEPTEYHLYSQICNIYAYFIIFFAYIHAFIHTKCYRTNKSVYFCVYLSHASASYKRIASSVV